MEFLVPGALIEGLDPTGPVRLESVREIGGLVRVTFRDGYGLERSELLNEDRQAELSVKADRRLGTFDASVEEFLLAYDALRIRHVSSIDPLQAVNASNIEPLPHQIEAVYTQMLAQDPLRFLLADDPGAGKTIMAGLLIRELLASGRVRRCVVVAPGSLVEQWRVELRTRFGLPFELYDATEHGAVSEAHNPFEGMTLAIVRLDQVARSNHLRDALTMAGFDLAVVDEAHKMSAQSSGNRIKKSRRYELGELLRDRCPNLVLMTATPHNGKDGDYALFLELLGVDLYGTSSNDAGPGRLAPYLRRLVKEQLVHIDGEALFPPRRASTLPYRLGAAELDLYGGVTEYVRTEMNKVSGDEQSRRTVGFALMVLQRRLASSPEAILRSLTRRRDRLEAQLTAIEHQDERLLRQLQASVGEAPQDEEELTAAEWERAQDEAANVATASRTPAELRTEILVVEDLVAAAERVRDSGVDRKWEALRDLLHSEEMYVGGRRRKIIIFTEHRDTLDYLLEQLSATLEPGEGIEAIHGGISRADRRAAQLRFTQDPNCSVLVATDAAGEGVNLQVAHLMVNYDIPWNPNRLEQRFGRIHRIGQRHVCHLWNLVAAETREGDVFTTLLTKLETQRQALGDRVFDVLGEVLTGVELTSLLTAAIRGEAHRHTEVLEQRIGADLTRAVATRSAAVSELTAEDLSSLRWKLALSQAAKLAPAVSEPFVLAALTRYGGDVQKVAGGRYRVAYVPSLVRERAHTAGLEVEPSYARVTFDRLHLDEGSDDTELVAPGHPLLEALVDCVLGEGAGVLSAGVALVDDRASEDCLLLSFVTTAKEGGSLVTLRVSGETIEPIDAAAYPSLAKDQACSAAEGRLAEAVALVNRELPASGSWSLAACAYVRGSATPERADEISRQRESVIRAADGTRQVGREFSGWDVAWEESNRITFARAATPGVERSGEMATELNLGSALVIHAPDGQ